MSGSRLENFAFNAGLISIGATVITRESVVKVLKTSLFYFGQSYKSFKDLFCGFDNEILDDFFEKDNSKDLMDNFWY
jgi:hypothetical protein